MFKEYLLSCHKINRLSNTWLIQSEDLAIALSELQGFLVEAFFNGKQDLSCNPDFKLVKVEENKNYIAMQQLRDLNHFLSMTCVMHQSKVVVIYQAELLNIYSSNACLKILEDILPNSYIFLITKNMSLILPTIRSRCNKITMPITVEKTFKEIYVELLNALLHIEVAISLIQKFANKNKLLWTQYANAILYLISRIIKKSININVALTKEETQIMNSLPNVAPNILVNKFDHLHDIINNTTIYDLELMASTVLLIEVFKN